MSLTLRLLVDTDTDTGSISANAQAWNAMADALDDATEDLIKGTRELEHVWPSGRAADAAQSKSRDTVNEGSNAVQPCRRIGRALREHADTLHSLQNTVHEITAEATARGYVVDLAAGTVAAGPRLLQDSAQGQHLAQAITSYVEQLSSILDRAAESDRSTANTINANLPNAQTGFGSLTASSVSQADLLAQRGRPPADVKAWWDSLTPAQQEQAIAAYPQIVGSLDGVPAEDRDPANRMVLDRDIATMTSRTQTLDARQEYILAMADQGRLQELYPHAMNPTGAAMAELDQIKDERAGIDDKLTGATTIQNRLDDPNKPPAYLLGFSSADDGRAIVSVGNPDLADNVVTYVPGTTSDLPGIAVDLERADTMAYDAKTMDTSGRTTASILWLGYDAPDIIPNAGSSSYATNAVDDLQNFHTGLRATHEGPPSHNTVIGHSYGTTTVGYAARDPQGLAANDLIFVGSPGVGVNTAADLHIEGNNGNVWASTAANDVIRLTGVEDNMRFGENPDNPGFDGGRFTSADGSWNPIATHSEYWDPHNPSRENITFIVTGQTDRVH